MCPLNRVHTFLLEKKIITVQFYIDIQLWERGVEDGNVVSMVVGVPSHLLEETNIKWVRMHQTLERYL